MRILLTGKNGQLGRCFQEVASSTAHQLFAYDSTELDISDMQQVAEVCAKVQPDVIVNAAAYTAVDKAEQEAERAYAVNEQGVRWLAEQAAQLDIPILHVSTDYVFDGLAVLPYQPTSATSPQGIYGASKRAGEVALLESGAGYVILRTAWVFSEYGNNFVKTMLRLAKERDALSVVADQYGCPTYAGDLAQALLQLCDQVAAGQTLACGVYHYCGDTPTSWHGFARTIFALAVESGVLEKAPKLTAISSADYPTPAQRPEYSVLDTAELAVLGVVNSPWLQRLKPVIQRCYSVDS